MRHMIATLLLFIGVAAQAGLSLQVDQSSVSLGQSFRLVLIEENGNTSAIPDFGPLRDNFTIVGTERSTNYSIINNEAHSTRQWTIVLIPKRAGTLTIPPLTVGQEQTQPTVIEVNAAQSRSGSQTAASGQEDVMLRAEVSKEQPYVNEQVIYTVRLYNSRRLLDASFQPPRVEDGLLIPLGDARRYQDSVQGRYYSVEEQKYAIFPQKSGPFAIKPPIFSALIYEDLPQQIKVQAPVVSLQVKAAAADFKGASWLPAKHLVLTETYDQAARTLEQGSTLIRTITMEATGLPAQLLPALAITKNEAVRVYQDKPVERNILRQGNVVGNTSVKVTYLFNKPGVVTVPAVQMSWFNTETGKEEISSLPEIKLTVTAAPGSTPSLVNKADTPVTRPEPVKDRKATDAAVPIQNSVAWWLVGGLLLAWGVTLQRGWRRRSGLVTNTKAPGGLQQLKSACANNQPEPAQKALLQWAKEQWPHAHILNLNDITRLTCDAGLNRHIDDLSEALYRAKAQSWSGQPLWHSIVSFKQSRVNGKADNDAMPPLNPG